MAKQGRKPIDLTGKLFGTVRVLRSLIDGERDVRGNVFHECVCEGCGRAGKRTACCLKHTKDTGCRFCSQRARGDAVRTKVLALVNAGGKTRREIAIECGVTPERVSQITIEARAQKQAA